MPGREHAEKLWANLMELGVRRLIALALIGLATIATVGAGAYYLSRPEQTVLYTGLDGEDVTRIGSALRDAGIPFDINSEGSAVMVSHAQTAKARMLLAEKGLPRGANSGYELFDELGSLGLTSFMQEVTRVRALEGELARTIQLMKGIRAARVHIVLPEKGSFRRDQQPPSASVVIRSDVPDDVRTADAIRHLVAAGVPGMQADKVTVLDTSGGILAAGKDPTKASAGQLASLETAVSSRIQENIRKTLTPYLGLDNFEVSVAAELNTDRKTIAETIFDPDSRTERSIRTIRENENAQNSSVSAPTTVEQNLPEEDVSADNGERSSEENERREETVNYEISSKRIETSQDGYRVDRLSIAVLVDKSRLAQSLGGEPTQAQLDEQLTEIEALVASSAGIEKERGDLVKVAVVDFIDGGRAMEPIPPISITEYLMRQSGNIINALAILTVSMLVIWFGLRPAVAALVPQMAKPQVEMAELGMLPEAAEGAAEAVDGDQTFLMPPDHSDMLQDLNSRRNKSALRKLESLLEFNEEQSAAILRQWLYESERI
ncbi:Flagellar M-ring protein [Labrenzia sp. THAF191b]|jgi:flagellar M-ring protein FliF|uniref:flagellar basal-body MS-ring/collar protein FliF n=1 Tax=unclassified Labrenzia TaxID=2648686 RepID=UPI001268D08B|nr:MULTISPECIES: flagellar basal-body MS-ring/collar protein FliF [unclassified Labrenzia]QFS99732.1 Flagellar M-ring protein [Labrenzia sp. THAF191b]QFT06046.1 Flagellar M-ring protein [Labrenzia sp. THAF191a]QFT17590.1 Flagellar M-ring protein [Labrenzia sp. THAF187b]